MSYQALYRTYRPTSFEEVAGQKHVVMTLMNAVKQNKVAHAYLFCGPRGTGKTSIARLLAKTLNCENQESAPCNTCSNCLSSREGTHQDIVEIDAASNSGVDQIRDLIEKVKYSPIQGRLKVYIIDEVHMLSPGAFNALLKTLEEPPGHVVFVLATTEPHKVLPTIISRCQRYDFSKVRDDEIISRMKHVLGIEKVEVEEDALRLIATLADGGMRDALSILDQCIAYAQNKITAQHVNDIYGITTVTQKIELLDSVFGQDAKKLLSLIQEYNEKGIDVRRLTSDLIEVLKEGVIYNYTKDETLLKILSATEAKELILKIDVQSALGMVDVLMETTTSYRNASNVTSYFEVAVLKMMAISDKGVMGQVNPVIKDVVKKEIVKEEKLQTEVKTKEIEPVKKVTKKKETKEELSIEFVLGLLVQANKETKENDRQQWKLLDSKVNDLEHARWARLLVDASVEASGDDFVLLVCDTEITASQINESENNKALYTFVKEQLALDKMIYAVSQDSFMRVTSEFRERYQNQTLPEKIFVERYPEAEQEVKKTKVEQLEDLFGDRLEVIDE
ncbi:MAG: DNA polymerase III subunit gamma/tau [Anaerorhabdus sp.]